jgi:hypothetical protein
MSFDQMLKRIQQDRKSMLTAMSDFGKNRQDKKYTTAIHLPQTSQMGKKNMWSY